MKNTPFVFLIIALSICSYGNAQELKLPQQLNKPAKTKSSPAITKKTVPSKSVILKSDFDATYILTNQSDLSVKYRVVITSGEKKESLAIGGYKVEIEDAQGKKYKAGKYLEVHANLAQVEFFKTNSGFDFYERSQSDLEIQVKDQRKSLVKSIIDANYASELKATITKRVVASASAQQVMDLLQQKGFATVDNVREFAEMMNVMESTHYNHLKLKEAIAAAGTEFYLDKNNYTFIRNLLSPLGILESKNKTFAGFWAKNEYYSVISDDVEFYCNSVRKEINALPLTEADFIAKVESNQLELKKIEIAKLKKENENVEINPILVQEVRSESKSESESESESVVKVKQKPTNAAVTSSRKVSWWDWNYWDWWEWLVYGALGVLGVLLLLSLILLIADEY